MLLYCNDIQKKWKLFDRKRTSRGEDYILSLLELPTIYVITRPEYLTHSAANNWLRELEHIVALIEASPQPPLARFA